MSLIISPVLSLRQVSGLRRWSNIVSQRCLHVSPSIMGIDKLPAGKHTIPETRTKVRKCVCVCVCVCFKTCSFIIVHVYIGCRSFRPQDFSPHVRVTSSTLKSIHWTHYFNLKSLVVSMYAEGHCSLT